MPTIIAPIDTSSITSPQKPPKTSMIGFPVDPICIDDIVVFLILAMLLGDIPFIAAMLIPVGTVVADRGYDSEWNHV